MPSDLATQQRRRRKIQQYARAKPRLSMREIGRRMGLSHTTVQRYLYAYKRTDETRRDRQEAKATARWAPAQARESRLAWVFRFIAAAQAINNMLRTNPAAVQQIWAEAGPRQRRYMKSELEGTLRIVTQLLEEVKP